MAARIRKTHQDDVRKKIQASQLVNYLQNHSLANGGSENANTRVRAATALLNKVLPDLSSTTHSGDPDSPVLHRIEQVIVDK